MVYLIITIASVDAAALFFPNHTLSLPIFHIDLNITYFFAATPILILVVHTNLLVNLSHHRNKLEAYIQEDDAASPMYYHPFLYNFIRKKPDRHQKYRFATTTLLRIFIWTSLVVLPLFVLVTLQVRFLPVQTTWVNLIHVVIVFVDALVLWWFRTAISTQPYPDRPDPEAESTEAPTLLQRLTGQKLLKLFMVIITPGLSLLLFSGAQLGTGKSPVFHFDLQEMVLAESPSDVQSILGSAPKLETAWAELAMGDKVENKQVRHGKFDRSIFTRISFRGSDLSHSSFQYTRFEYANFQDAKAFKADFNGAYIRVGLFFRAKMDSVRFARAEFSTVDFDSCVMHYGDFTDATMYGASFVDADLSGSNFSGAKLAGANFSNAVLKGADFSDADLTGADFSNARLDGAIFSKTWIDCADFTRATMSGVFIVNSQASGVNFDGTNLDGAFFGSLRGLCIGWRNISNPHLIQMKRDSSSKSRDIDSAWYAARIPEKVHISPQSESLQPRAAFIEKLSRIRLDCPSLDNTLDFPPLDTVRYIRLRDSLICYSPFIEEPKSQIQYSEFLRVGRKPETGFICPEE